VDQESGRRPDDKAGVPLVIRTAGASAGDHRQILPVILDFPEAGGTPGRPMDAWAAPAAGVVCFRIPHHDAMQNPGFVRTYSQ